MMSPNHNANRTSQPQPVGQDATLGLEAALRSHLSGVLLKSVPLAAYPQPVQIIKYDFATISSPAIAGMQEIERGLIYHREDVVPGSSRRDLRAGFLLGWIDNRKLHVLLGRGAQMYTAWHASELQAYLIVTSSDEFKSLFANAADGRIEMQAQEPLDLDGARYIYHIAVKPAARRLGLGQVLLEGVKQDQNQPLVTDIAISPVNNAASLSFMHKHGFRDVALVFDHSFPWAETVISQAMAWEPAPFDHSCGGHALCNAHHLRLKGEQPVTGCYAALSEAAAPISITSHSWLLTPEDGKASNKGWLIPSGAIRIQLPDVRQPDGYSCGASALMSICAYYGVGPRTIDEFKKELGTNPESGTNYREMVRFARSLGLDARAEVGWTPDQLEAAVAKGHPVIVAIQAYAEDPHIYQDPRRNEDGHYVVVIGFDRENYYMEDPSLARHRGFLPKSEFLRRWHDDEGTPDHPRVVERLGLEFGPGRTGDPSLERAVRID